MPPEIYYLIILLVLAFFIFKFIGKHVRLISIGAALMLSWFLCNIIFQDKNKLSSLSGVIQGLTHSIVGFGNFIDKTNRKLLAQNQLVHESIATARDERHRKMRKETREYQLELLRQRREKERKQKAFINKIRNAEIW